MLCASAQTVPRYGDHIYRGLCCKKCAHMNMHTACALPCHVQSRSAHLRIVLVLKRQNMHLQDNAFIRDALAVLFSRLRMTSCPGDVVVGREMMEEEAGHSSICVNASQNPAAAQSPACSRRPVAIPSPALSGAAGRIRPDRATSTDMCH